MTRRLRILSILAVLTLSLADLPIAHSAAARNHPVTSGSPDGTRPVSADISGTALTASAQQVAQQAFGRLPLYFVENQGQVDKQVVYYVQGHDKTVYFTPEGVTFALAQRQTTAGERAMQHETRNARYAPQRWSVKLDFVGANPNVCPIGQEKTDAIISYFTGPCDQWHTALSTYSRLIYHDLWPGIDLVYYGTVNQLKYEFVVHPGADPGRIQLLYRGATVALNAEGQLTVSTPLGGFADDAPLAYQEMDGKRASVPIAYVFLSAPIDYQPESRNAQSYGFAVGPYDSTRVLIIDPTMLLYCGYIGSPGRDEATSIAVDKAGYAYIAGWTDATETTFPVTSGPDLTFGGGGADAFVAKVKADGSGLVYCGYIGGSGGDYGEGIAVDETGQAYVTGFTGGGLPVIGGPNLIHNGPRDAFVAKVNATGSGLVYCGYIGGSGNDWGFGIAVDGSGQAYVIGDTDSAEATFPITVGPDLTYNGGVRDVFVARVKEDGSGLAYCGYIGGSGDDWGYGIAVDESGHAYVTGDTGSNETTFPVTGGPDLTYGGGGDAFVAKVKVDGSGLAYCGYIGGSDSDVGRGIAVDGTGHAYVTGDTRSTEASFPVTGGPDLTFGGFPNDAFVTKVKADGSGLAYCGYIGGSSSEYGYGIAVDGAGNAYITGETGSDETTFPVTDGPDLTYNANDDIFVAEVNATGSGLVYCGYIGGFSGDTGRGIAVDGAGNAYVTGVTQSPDTPSWLAFPVIGGPDLTYNGGIDTFVAKIGQGKPPTHVVISGPTVGFTQTTTTFHAAVSPVTATIPFTHVWQATGQAMVTHTGCGLSDSVSFTWTVTGLQAITVTASNALGTVTGTHTISISTIRHQLYLPLVLKQ